jgi:hypothetical protein
MDKTEKFEAFTNIRCLIPLEFDYELNLHIAELKKIGVHKTKAQLIIEFARQGLLANKFKN